MNRQMAPATGVGTLATPTTLYELIAGKLPATMPKVERMFSEHEILAPGRHRIRPGPVIRRAWEAETGFDDVRASEIAALLLDALDRGDLSGYPTPSCCDYHRDIKNSSFAAGYAPDDEEVLSLVSQLLWIILPNSRGFLGMTVPKKRYVTASRFMLLEAFLDRHHKTVIGDASRMRATVSDYSRRFAPSCPWKLRQADLKAEHARGLLQGMLGTIPAKSSRRPEDARYCTETQPFSTPTLGPKQIDRDGSPPDRMLHRLGLDFDRNKKYVELVYRIKLEPPSSPAAAPPRGAAAPTVLDARGYWLFRPDRREIGSGRTLWNYTRDVASDGRGLRELISPPISAAQLVDLLVWPRRTASNWITSAAPSLAADLLAP